MTPAPKNSAPTIASGPEMIRIQSGRPAFAAAYASARPRNAAAPTHSHRHASATMPISTAAGARWMMKSGSAWANGLPSLNASSANSPRNRPARIPRTRGLHNSQRPDVVVMAFSWRFARDDVSHDTSARGGGSQQMRDSRCQRLSPRPRSGSRWRGKWHQRHRRWWSDLTARCVAAMCVSPLSRRLVSSPLGPGSPVSRSRAHSDLDTFPSDRVVTGDGISPNDVCRICLQR